MPLLLVLTIIAIILGATGSFVISRYFFKKSVRKKNLSPYIHFATKVFSGIDPDLKNKLRISYESNEIENLVQVQFVIANTGNKSIRDCIKPLTLEINEDLEILDVNIVYISPEGRDVKPIIEKSKVIFEFPLLDIEEYFVAKCLFKTIKVDKKEENEEKSMIDNFSFRITVDELPPKLEIETLPYDYIERNSRDKDWGMVWAILVILVVTISQSLVLYKFNDFDTTYFLFNFKQFFSNFSFYHLVILLSWFSIIGEILIMITFISIARDEIMPKRKAKFNVPKEIIDFYSEV